MADGRLHDGSPVDEVTAKPGDHRVRRDEVERWGFAGGRSEKSRHANGHAIALHFACQTLDARGW